MSWASRRQYLILGGVVAVILTLIAVTTIAIVYDAPSCTDGKRNGEETGIDCGGSCMYICRVDAEDPIVRFVRAFSPRDGRYDVIAYVDNRNPTYAVKEARATVELYSEDRLTLSTKEITFDIPAGGTVPVYVPEAYRGSVAVATAFLTLDEESLRFYTPEKKHTIPSVMGIEITNGNEPRVFARLQNPTAFPLYDITPIATVFDGEGNAMAASRTYVPQLSGQGETDIVFTWNAPFWSMPARVEVLPVMPVSRP